jgi:hypothetical protein
MSRIDSSRGFRHMALEDASLEPLGKQHLKRKKVSENLQEEASAAAQ